MKRRILQKNFDTASPFRVIHNDTYLQKHYDALCILLEDLQYNFWVIGITETVIRKD